MLQYRNHLVALAFFVLLAFIILHPIITFTGSRVAGFDYFNYHWNFWWIRHALTTPDLNVFETNFVFFPFENNLGYHALTAFWFPLWAILEPVTGTLAAVTVIIFTGAVLNGYVFYWFLRRDNPMLGGPVCR